MSSAVTFTSCEHDKEHFNLSFILSCSVTVSLPITSLHYINYEAPISLLFTLKITCKSIKLTSHVFLWNSPTYSILQVLRNVI